MIAPDDERVLKIFTNDPVGLVRAEAARALGEIGPDAKAAVKYLEERAETDPAKQVRYAAQEALRKINAER